MKRSLFALAAGLLVAATAAVSNAVMHAWEPIATVFKTVVFGPTNVSAAEADEQPASKPRVALRRAGQFVLRVLKREQPVVTPDWRMVPSSLRTACTACGSPRVASTTSSRP